MKLNFPFAPFPREIWDLQIELTQGEFRLYGWFLCGARLGFKQLSYTDDQILSGCPTQPGHEDQPPLGMSRNSMKRSREGLVAKSLLLAEQISDGSGVQGAAWKYALNLVSTDDTKASSGVNDGHRSCQQLIPLVSNLDTLIRNGEKAEETEKNKGVSIPNWIPLESWNAYLEMRKDKKKNPTPKAVKMIIEELDECRKRGQSVKRILDRSTMNCWTGVFSLDNNGNGHRNGSREAPEAKWGQNVDDVLSTMYQK